jgi:hypothetical protein
MPGSSCKPPRYLRWLCELLFSLYVGFFVVDTFFGSSDHTSKEWLAAPVVVFDRLLSRWREGRLFFPRSDAELALNLALDIFWAMVVFVCLRLLHQIPRARTFLTYVIVVVAIVGVAFSPGPLFGRVYTDRHLQPNGELYQTDEGHLHAPRALQEMEVVLTLALLCFFLVRVRRWRTAMIIVLLAAHFSFWFAYSFGEDWRPWEGAALVYLLLPFASSLTWAFLQRERGRVRRRDGGRDGRDRPEP